MSVPLYPDSVLTGPYQEPEFSRIESALCAAIRNCNADTAHLGTQGVITERPMGRNRDGSTAPRDLTLERMARVTASWVVWCGPSRRDRSECIGDQPDVGPVIAVPISRRGTPFVSLALSRAPGSPPFDASEFRHLQVLANDLERDSSMGQFGDSLESPVWPGPRLAVARRSTAPPIPPIVREFMPGYVFVSEAMHRVRERCLDFARRDCPVLILGATGTGKEGVAEFIHARSCRSKKPMIPEDLSGEPDSLIDTELRGHAKGAFTDAKEACAGLFERAHESTLFLDEIQNATVAVQKKLLRLLEQEGVRRVGGRVEFAADFRLIASSNENLRALVEAGRFRRDLYHRLRVGVIRLPTLAERKEDILPIARAWLAANRSELRLHASAEEWLQAQPWPGNVRELIGLLAGCVLNGETSITASVLAAEASDDDEGPPPNVYPGLKPRIDEFTKREVLRAFGHAGGKPSEVAKILRVLPRRVRYLRRKYGIARDSGEISPPGV